MTIKETTIGNNLEAIKKGIEACMSLSIDLELRYNRNILMRLAQLHYELDKYFKLEDVRGEHE